MSQLERSELDRFFGIGFLLQWAAVFAATWTLSGRALDLFFAVVVGAALASAPTMMDVFRPGSRLTRYVVAVAQMLYGVLAVHLTGGKLGTHYHVLASLSFLALYRDGRVLLTAAAIAAVDTVGVDLLRGEIAPLHWLQELSWIGLSAGFLVYACRRPSVTVMVPSMTTFAEPVLIAEASAPTLRPAPIAEVAVYSDLEHEAGMGELLGPFVQRLQRSATALERAATSEELRDIAQQLRGAAASYGFRSISAAAASLEEAVDAGADIAPRSTALIGLCRRARCRGVILRAA